jgi:hypothetical protein
MATNNMLVKATSISKEVLNIALSPSITDEVEEVIIKSLKAHRKVGQPLYARIVHILIISTIKKKTSKLLLENEKTAFRISIEWIKRFLKSELNWTI